MGSGMDLLDSEDYVDSFGDEWNSFTEDKSEPFTKEDLIDIVNKFLRNEGRGLRYLVAGGSCVDAEAGKNLKDINDIDVWFTDEEAFEGFRKSLINVDLENASGNALTYTLKTEKGTRNIQLQLIKKRYGTPYQIIDGFDLSASKIGIDNNYKVYRSDDQGLLNFYEDIVKSSTPSRLVKYRGKGYILLDDVKYRMIDYLIENREKEFDDMYNNVEMKKKGIAMLSIFIHALVNDENINEVVTYILDNTEQWCIKQKTKFWRTFSWFKDKTVWKHNIIVLSQLYRREPAEMNINK